MLTKVRTYHSIHRFLVMSVFAMSILSFIGHACLIDEAHGMSMMKKCCCEEVQSRHEGAHSGHEGMEEAPKCDHGSDSHGNAALNDCCSAEFNVLTTTVASRTKATTARLVSAVPVILAQSGDVIHPIVTSGLFIDLSPPPISSPPIRILYAQFLI